MNVVIYSLLVVIAYPYVIYPWLSFLISRFKTEKKHPPFYPSVTVLIAAYNEIDYIRQKLNNTYALEYPLDLLQVIVLTDGSTDGTDLAVTADGRAILIHNTERKGKAAALNSAIEKIESAIVVCTDANTMLNKDALVELVKHFEDPLIGAVAGEKRIITEKGSGGTVAEGFYWKYESKLRQWDSKIFSVIGAAGELYAIRRELVQTIPPDTVCEDLLITMRVIANGKRVVYEPLAYGTEKMSETVVDEWKRKVRIAAGSIQFLGRIKVLNFFINQPFAAFQFMSRKLFRWLIVPYSLIGLLLTGSLQIFQTDDRWILIICIAQFFFYCWAVAGWFFSRYRGLPGVFFFPFYFVMANAAIIAGTSQYIMGKSFVLWDRVKRS